MQSSNKKLTLMAVEYGKKSLVPKEIVYARINPEYGTMIIGKAAALAMCMEGKFYRLFYDVSNGAIAWQVRGDLTQDQIMSKLWKLSKQDEQGQITIGVKRVLIALGAFGFKSMKLEIQKWNAKKESLLEDGDYYFVEVKETTV